MILGPISLIDCVVFVIFLIPQLLYQVGFLSSLLLVGKVLPFLSEMAAPVRCSNLLNIN